ncbi:MAG: LptF/LptG family permease [Nitrospirae bacterium]|jgi:lipopolysaccharide export system permease protein|nr:LptF/LptG family permease [Nitrospirota bacterium]
MKIIHRYLFFELLPPFVIGLLVLVVLILTQQTLMIMNLLVNKGLSIPTVLRLVLMIFPQFLTMIIPVSVLAASTATFNRFASDGEITALKASGIGLSRLLWPLVFFAFLGYLGSFYMSLKAQETQGMSLQEMISTVLKKKMSLGIRPQVFNNFMDRFVIYVDRMPTFSRMQGVFIYQEGKGKAPSTVIMAREGSLMNERNGRPGIRIQLRSGTLLQGGAARQFVRFSSYDLTIFGQSSGSTEKPPTIRDLEKAIALSPNPDVSLLRALEDRYKNYTYPFSCLIFAFLGIPFGIYAKRSGRLAGFVFATASVIFFYILNTVDDLMVARRLMNPFVASLVPDLVLGTIMIFLLVMVFREISLSISLPSLSGFLKGGSARP